MRFLRKARRFIVDYIGGRKRLATDPNNPSSTPGRGDLVAYQPLIFLDTNNLHWARLYIEFAASQNLYPVGNRVPAETDTELRRHFVGRTLSDYRKGARIVEHLRKQRLESDARVEYSPVTALEVICGLLRGRAILEAAQARLAHRMWGHIDEWEIVERLTSDAYQEIQERTTDLEAEFEKAGIVLRETTSDRIREVWSLARAILGCVYLDVGDVVVYASALLAEADELMSGDGYLRSIANSIRNPGALEEPDKTYYRRVQVIIRQAVAEIIGVSVEDIRVPTAPDRL